MGQAKQRHNVGSTIGFCFCLLLPLLTLFTIIPLALLPISLSFNHQIKSSNARLTNSPTPTPTYIAISKRRGKVSSQSKSDIQHQMLCRSPEEAGPSKGHKIRHHKIPTPRPWYDKCTTERDLGLPRDDMIDPTRAR